MNRTLGRIAKAVAVFAVTIALALVATTALAQAGVPPKAAIPGGAMVLGVLTWLAAFALKKWDGFVNQGIGWVVALLSLFGYAVIPGEANAAAFLSLGGLKALGLPVAAALQTWIVTGIHEWVLGSLVEPLMGKRNKGTTYIRRQ